MADSYLMPQVRRARGLSLAAVAEKVGTDPSNLAKVERGEQIPKRALARRLFDFYSGAVPLDAIYDPEFVAAGYRPPSPVTVPDPG